MSAFRGGLSWYLDTPYPMAAITSGSMWPVLKEGSLVFIKSVKKKKLKSAILLFIGTARALRFIELLNWGKMI